MKRLVHVWRAKEEPIESLMNWEPAGRRRRYRPRSKWLKEIKKELRRRGNRECEGKATLSLTRKKSTYHYAHLKNSCSTPLNNRLLCHNQHYCHLAFPK